MSSNILPPRSPRKKRVSPTMPPADPEMEADAGMGMGMPKPKKPRKTNIGNAMRQKNRRVSSPMV